MSKKQERHFKAELFDGRGTAVVGVVDGNGHYVSELVHVTGVHTEQEAVTAALEADHAALMTRHPSD
jgi:hypothetical protein